jgi:hypothetical protein
MMAGFGVIGQHSFVFHDLLVDELFPLFNSVFPFVDTVVVWTGCGLEIVGGEEKWLVNV